MNEPKMWLFTCPQCDRKMLLHESQAHSSASCPHGRKRVEMVRELLPRKEALARYNGKPERTKKRSSKSKNNTPGKSKTKRANKSKKKNRPEQLCLGL